MIISPWIVGSGRAGLAIAKSFACVATMEPELGIRPARFVTRGTPLERVVKGEENPVIAIATPHGLHCDAMLAAERAGFRAILCEKPSCVSLEQRDRLSPLRTTTAVLHGYRNMWGPQTLRSLVAQGDLGEIISVEGRYWQASTAIRAITNPVRKDEWKNDPRLCGTHDALLDTGSHWADLVAYLVGQLPTRASGWLSYKNASAAHRDSHVQLALEFADGSRSLGSISKTAHGATNQLEVTVLGTRRSASWHLLSPDELVIGEGRDRRVQTRAEDDLGSRQPPFHGLGWLEGYIEIIRQVLGEVFQGRRGNFPRLEESLALTALLLQGDFGPRAQGTL